MASFRTLDSDHKADRGGRGVGRLMWLKAFEEVEVSSGFVDAGGAKRQRRFRFDAESDISGEELAGAQAGWKRETKVHLDGFQPRFRSAAPGSAEPIARSLFEHCLWYFVRPGGAPGITVEDGDAFVDLDEVYEEHMHSSAVTEAHDLKGNRFRFTHVKLRATSARSHSMAFCAASRLVKSENLVGKVPGLFGRLRDDSGEFVYVCYVIANFLDEHVRPERTGFNLSERSESLFEGDDLSLDNIREKTIELAAAHLEPYVAENKSRVKERVERFVARKAPRYWPILPRIPQSKLNLDPDVSEKELELALHREFAAIESQVILEGRALLSRRSTPLSNRDERRIAAYLQKVEDVKQSDLVGYAANRQLIIDLFAQAIERDEDGGYAREGLLHQLMMPVQVDKKGGRTSDCNLWLVDERLAFHYGLGFDDAPGLSPAGGAASAGQPDTVESNEHLVACEESESSQPSIVVVQLSKGASADAKPGQDSDPIEQALSYVDRIRKGEAKTAAGRPLAAAQGSPGFCYLLCDLTPTLIELCRSREAVPTADGLGYSFYSRTSQTYVEVSSLDRVLQNATRRNRAFFARLGIPQ